MSAARLPLVAGNWKCHKTVVEALALATEVKHGAGALRGVEIAVAPPFTALQAVGKRLEGSAVVLASQDCHWEDAGAFTAAVSAPMLRELGCRYAIVGHSERRHVFRETDDEVRKKLRAALRGDLRPILCIGETLDERDGGRTLERLAAQLEAALSGLGAADAANVVVAYEPVWAIGTGRNATPAQAQEAHAHVREVARALLGGVADGLRILYGGSVKPDNAAELLGQRDVDGALVGGASLEAKSFLAIARAAAGRG
ncbi:MAG: triose-phosphate isomerase [Myxococcota bacterium]